MFTISRRKENLEHPGKILLCPVSSPFNLRVPGPQDGKRGPAVYWVAGSFLQWIWGSVCRSPMEDITVSMICRQLGCGDSGTLNSSVGLREGSRPQWLDGIRCQKTDTSLWQCPSDPWNYTSCSPKEEAYISCAGDSLYVSVCLS